MRHVAATVAGCSTWGPLARSGCILAIDPSQESYAEGASVSTLHDLSGYGNNGTQSGAARPTFQRGIWRTGRPGILFTAASAQYFDVAGVAALLSGSDVPYTLGMVLRIVHTSNQDILSLSHSTGSAQIRHYLTGSNWTAYRKDDAASTAFRTGSAGVSSDIVLTIQFTGTTVTYRVNGTAVVDNQAFNVGAATFDSCRLGRQVSAAGYMSGYLGAFVLYNRLLAASEVVALEAELTAWHYTPGITATGAVPGAAQVIPTYDTSNQPCHPDVIDAGAGNTVCGTERYAMAMTPLPGGASTFENRSILTSSDGGVTDAWAAPVGLTNPVDPVLGGGLVEADPDIVLDGATCWLIWQSYYGAGNTRCFKAQSSADLVTWETPVVLFDAPAGDVSPSLVKVGSSWHCYYVTGTGQIVRRTSAAVSTGWGAPLTVNVPMYANQVPWHINVTIDATGALYMLVCAHVDTRTWLYRSTDGGENWVGCNQATITGSGAVFVRIYRSAIVPLGDDVLVSGLACWLGGYTVPGVYKVGYTTISVAVV